MKDAIAVLLLRLIRVAAGVMGWAIRASAWVIRFLQRSAEAVNAWR